MLNTYDKLTLFQYFGQRPFSRKNMHFSLVRVSMKHVFFATFTGKAVRRRGVTFMST